MPEAPSFPPAPLQPSRRQPAHWFPVSRHARKAPARAPRQADHALRPHPLPLAPAEHPQSGLFARPRPLFMAILAACLALPASARTEEVSDQVPPAAATPAALPSPAAARLHGRRRWARPCCWPRAAMPMAVPPPCRPSPCTPARPRKRQRICPSPSTSPMMSIWKPAASPAWKMSCAARRAWT